MNNNVIISIHGEQHYEDQEKESIELVTEGCLEGDGSDGFTLTYQESRLTGLEGTLTAFQIEKGRITLLRIGEVNTQMVFEQGRRYLSMYETPYGTMSIGINTRKMRSDLGPAGGSIELDYEVEINHVATGQNLCQIDVRQKTGQLQRGWDKWNAGHALSSEERNPFSVIPS